MAVAKIGVEVILSRSTLDSCIDAITNLRKIPEIALKVIRTVSNYRNNVSKAFAEAVKLMSDRVLAQKYCNMEWDKRQKDFVLVEKLADKHTSILSFVEEYSLNPGLITQIEPLDKEDVVTVITIHSAKGTESKVCYVVNVSPGAFPSAKACGNGDDIEEERRVLYVALTRAMDELIVTRRNSSRWATEMKTDSGESIESYFFNDLPDEIFDERIPRQKSVRGWSSRYSPVSKSRHKHIGITI
jgi:DNA helicase-2/ATP-dependent DNA helicase PcrA